MNTFIWVIVILFALEIIGKAVMIAKQDFTRNVNGMILDMVAVLILLMWGIWTLAAN